MQVEINESECRARLKSGIFGARAEKSADTSVHQDQDSRCDNLLQLVRPLPTEGIDTYQFNDMTDFDIDVVPGILYDGLASFNENIYGEKLIIEP